VQGALAVAAEVCWLAQLERAGVNAHAQQQSPLGFLFLCELATMPLNMKTDPRPITERLDTDPRFTGRGITLALVDSGFWPHPDLVQPTNRITAWVDAADDFVNAMRFSPDASPDWPGAHAGAAFKWHGLMTSTVAAGNGWLSGGLYRGLASEARLVLVRARDVRGHINNTTITRALRWLLHHREELDLRVVSLSVGGEWVTPLAGNAVDEYVHALIDAGVCVVSAAGNDGMRNLVPPATAPRGITVGGVDDQGDVDPHVRQLWNSNYGETVDGMCKPDLIAPSLWVPAPVLPYSVVSSEAEAWFRRLAHGDSSAQDRITELRLLTPHYQHVEGTSFAAPIVASVAACMLEANPALTPTRVKDILMQTAQPLADAPRERQGAGVVNAGVAMRVAHVGR
jgi:serine protease AprX